MIMAHFLFCRKDFVQICSAHFLFLGNCRSLTLRRFFFCLKRSDGTSVIGLISRASNNDWETDVSGWLIWYVVLIRWWQSVDNWHIIKTEKENWKSELEVLMEHTHRNLVHCLPGLLWTTVFTVYFRWLFWGTGDKKRGAGGSSGQEVQWI